VETIVVIGVLALVAIGLALWPFRGRRSTRAPAPVPQEPAVAVREELEARYAALAELDEDFAAGKFSPQDYSQLRAEMESAAAALLVRVECEPHGAAACEWLLGDEHAVCVSVVSTTGAVWTRCAALRVTLAGSGEAASALVVPWGFSRPVILNAPERKAWPSPTAWISRFAPMFLSV